MEFTKEHKSEVDVQKDSEEFQMRQPFLLRFVQANSQSFMEYAYGVALLCLVFEALERELGKIQ